MILAVLYAGAGIYFLLMFFGILHREFMKTMPAPARTALVFLAGGLIVVGSYYAWYYTYRSSEEGKALIKAQEEMNRGLEPPRFP